MSGWLKLHRSIEAHWLYTENRKFSRLEAWLDILIAVNYAEAKVFIKGKIYTVKRGESIMSLDSWGKRWNWDKSKVRRFFELLVIEKMIEIETDNITTHLKVCNYASYQDERNANETQTKRKRNADEIQTTPIEEEEEDKQEKKGKKNNIEERKLKFASTLEEFKEVYPRDMLNAFYRYWSEPNKSNTKFKQELEKTWDLSGRLTTWASRDKTFNKQNNQPQQQKPLGATNQFYRDPTPEDDRIKRMKSQINLYTAKVKKDYVLGVNYTENDLQDYLEKNINGYSRNQSYL